MNFFNPKDFEVNGQYNLPKNYREFAKSSCKKCWGKGEITYVIGKDFKGRQTVPCICCYKGYERAKKAYAELEALTKKDE